MVTEILIIALYLLILGGCGFGVALLWFQLCHWDSLFNCRNYKPVLILMPLTIGLTYLILGAPTLTKSAAPVTEASSSIVEKAAVKAKNGKKEVSKKREAPVQTVKKEEPGVTISFDYIRLFIFLGVLFGAPGFFWFLIDSHKIADVQTAREKFYAELDKELTHQRTKFNDERAKSKAKLDEKEAELKVAREKLKYLTGPPPPKPDPVVVTETGNFEDDLL